MFYVYGFVVDFGVIVGNNIVGDFSVVKVIDGVLVYNLL